MNRVRVNQIIENMSAFATVQDNAINGRRAAISAYCGTIFDLMAPDNSKAHSSWYSNLLRHAQIMVESMVCYDKLHAISEQQRTVAIDYGNESIGENEWCVALLKRKMAVTEVCKSARSDLFALLLEILDCNGDASKIKEAA